MLCSGSSSSMAHYAVVNSHFLTEHLIATTRPSRNLSLCPPLWPLVAFHLISVWQSVSQSEKDKNKVRVSNGHKSLLF